MSTRAQDKQLKGSARGRCLFLLLDLFRSRSKESLVRTDGVSDRGSDAHYVVGGEVSGVVENLVVAHFWPHEYVAPDVVADATSHIDQEVVGAGVAGAKGLAGKGGDISIEASALPANAAHQVKAGLFADAGLVDTV